MRAKQSGASMLTVLVWLLVGVSAITISLKLIPIYIDDFAIKGALEGLEKKGDLAKMSKKDIRSSLEKQFQVNNVRGFSKDNVSIVKDKKGVTITIDYEVRTNIVRNIDAIVSFNHKVESANQ